MQLSNGETTTILLHAGETLVITTEALSTALVLRLPDSPGGTIPYTSWAVGANSTGKVGPFVNPKRLQITAANGAIAYLTARLEAGQGSLLKVADTNGTTPVHVFDANGAPAAYTIRSVFVIAKDTTAGNIITKNNANTVATVAKGVTAGVLVGASSLANTSLAERAAFTIESSSAGNATVLIGLDPA